MNATAARDEGLASVIWIETHCAAVGVRSASSPRVADIHRDVLGDYCHRWNPDGAGDDHGPHARTHPVSRLQCLPSLFITILTRDGLA